jgi:hypothetical protein
VNKVLPCFHNFVIDACSLDMGGHPPRQSNIDPYVFKREPANKYSAEKELTGEWRFAHLLDRKDQRVMCRPIRKYDHLLLAVAEHRNAR